MAEGAGGGATTATVIADRYELGALLGRGAMGEVRAAKDRRLGRDVAVKLLLPALAADPSARERFRDEARATARIEHPHVVAVFDTGEHDGAPYLVMERLPGRTLADEIAAGPLPAPRVRALAVEVLGAVQAAHDAGVLHRDIKPGNILLTSDGGAKLADLGIAKTVEGDDRTATGIVVGTPSYLAPERMAGHPATERTDLYAVGVVLVEALTGTKPGPTDAAVPDAAGWGDPTLLGAIERARAADPDQRYGSAADMAAAIAPAPSVPTVASAATLAPRAVEGPSTAVAGGATRRAVVADRAGAGAAPIGRAGVRARTVRRLVAGGLALAVMLTTLAVALDRFGADGAGDSPAPGVTATTSPLPAGTSPEVAQPTDEGPGTGTAEAGTDGSGPEGSGSDGPDGNGPGDDGSGADAEKADEAAKDEAEKADEAAKDAAEKADEAAKDAAEKADEAAKDEADEAEDDEKGEADRE